MSVEVLDHQPEKFSHMTGEHYRFLRLTRNNEEYGMAAIGEHPDCLEVHLEISRWGVGARKALAQDCEWLRDQARKMGKTRLVGLKQETGKTMDERWPKFTRLFGFTGHAVLQTAFMDID